MQVPIRKKETYVKPKPDPYLTEEKFQELQRKLESLKKRHPGLSAEVKRLAEMGDFSENAGYQLAKGRLRGLNQRILELEVQLREAIVFRPNRESDIVSLGRRVTVISSGQKKSYTILGSVETDPAAGVISHNSPLGQGLLGHRVGETLKLMINGREKEFKIVALD